MSADPEQGTTTTADGATIAWSHWPGSGPPVVLVHGITDDRGSWFDIPGAFAEAGHRVVAVDLRGHGESSADAPELATMATDVLAVVDDLGLAPAVLVGHSLGGIVVTATAALAPDRVAAVVNVDQSLRLDEFGALVGSIWPALEADLAGTLSAVFATMTPERLDPAQRARLDANVMNADGDVVRAIWAPLVEHSPEDLAALVDATVGGVGSTYLAIHGSDPGADYATWLTTRIPTAVVEVWDGGLHFPHLVEQDRFVARVRALAEGS